MNVNRLTAISPLEGRYQEKITSLRTIFSEYGLMRSRLIVEVRWLQMLTRKLKELPKLSSAANIFLNALIDNFDEKAAVRIKDIESTINHDVKAVEYFIKESLKNNAELSPLCEFIHFGLTSEDINNLAYALMLKKARSECIIPAMDDLLEILTNDAHRYADIPMLARTHGQAATPTTVGKEFANFVARLRRQYLAFNDAAMLGKINGASGNYNALLIAYPQLDWQSISEAFVTELDLTWNPYTTQIEPHDFLAEIFSILIRFNNIVIQLNRDVWGYIALDYFKQLALPTEVGSSTMPHKINPIDFENSEGNLGIANALLEHMVMKLPISRWQRDLTDSTVLRNIGTGIAHALLAYQSTCRGLKKLSVNQDALDRDLDQHWEILGEALQTVMRRYNIPEPYERLKAFTRGKPITQKLIHEFIHELSLPDSIKETLYKLTPNTYIGLAPDLAKKI